MLCDIFDKLGIDSYDTELIRTALLRGHTWALTQDYPLEEVDEATPQQVDRVQSILEMWQFIEASYERLSPEDKKKVDGAGQDRARFKGFDGNYETREMSIANLLVNKMGRWERFKGRDLNAHMPTLDAHERMLTVFRPMLENRGLRDLTADEILELLDQRTDPSRRA